MQIKLPTNQARKLETYVLAAEPLTIENVRGDFNRIALSAAHVVANPLSETSGGLSSIDWNKTIAYRRYLLTQGLGIAEAMDTAQRGMGLDWKMAQELIARTIRETTDMADPLIFSGCGTDQLGDQRSSISKIEAAYVKQISFVERLGGRTIMMASRSLTKTATSPSDYASIYKRVLAAADKPVILHWLGEMFDPELAGYWGASSFDEALKTVTEIINESAAKVDGIKISLLDKDKEVRLRRVLPQGVKMYTGDDFNYPELIVGDEHGYSHALLGIFDAIAPAASRALVALARGDLRLFDELLAPTLPLSRHIFMAPTRFYKTGVVFLAYLNGHQDHFVMLGGQQSMRSVPHFVSLFKLAEKARLLRNPDLAVTRMRAFLELNGVAA
jgi:hypothetical protein